MKPKKELHPPTSHAPFSQGEPEIFLGEPLPSAPPRFWSSIIQRLFEAEWNQTWGNCIAIILPALLTIASTMWMGFPFFGALLIPAFLGAFFMWLFSPIPAEKELGRSLSIGCALSGFFVFAFVSGFGLGG